MTEKPSRTVSARALVFAAALPQLQLVAREHGYALAVHGSMARDLDLIAAPWVEEASEPALLIEALRVAVGGFILKGIDEWDDPQPEYKPCGRMAWSIYLENERGGPYLDVSVMPRMLASPPPRDGSALPVVKT